MGCTTVTGTIAPKRVNKDVELGRLAPTDSAIATGTKCINRKSLMSASKAFAS